jgi:hypothetical protein
LAAKRRPGSLIDVAGIDGTNWCVGGTSGNIGGGVETALKFKNDAEIS